MWSFLRICPLALLLASVGAFAEPGAYPPTTVLPADPPTTVLPYASTTALPYAQPPNTAPEVGPPSEEEIREKTAYWHDECIRDWDRQTHMSKQEWAATCQRIVADRVKWLRSQDHLESLYGP